MIYLNSADNFRVTEWPKSQASHFMYFNTPKLQYDLSALVEFLAKALFNTNKTFVRRSTFSLVNVTSNIANLSYGYSSPPYKTLRHFHPLTLTFAFTSRNTYDGEIKPKFSMRPYPYSTMWGHTLLGNSDFITIQVPKTVMRDMGLLVPNIRELQWLYMALGAWSKGFATRFSFYTRTGDYRSKPIDPHMAFSRLYRANMQRVFKREPYDTWAYSKEIWNLAPNIISPRMANEDFQEYYCRYLADDFYGKYPSANVLKIERRVEEFVESGLIEAMSAVADDSLGNLYGNVVSRNLMTVMQMVDGDAEYIKQITNVSESVKQILAGTYRRAP